VGINFPRVIGKVKEGLRQKIFWPNFWAKGFGRNWKVWEILLERGLIKVNLGIKVKPFKTWQLRKGLKEFELGSQFFSNFSHL